MRLNYKPPVILSSIKNSKTGCYEPITLNSYEKHNVKWMANVLKNQYGNHPQTPFMNALGYEVAVTTLTTVVKKVSEQSFYEISPAEAFPVVVGQGTYSSNLTTFRSFSAGDEFESGVINTGSNNARLAQSNAAVDSLNIKVNNWGKGYGWTIFDLELAAMSGNWDLVSALERSRKENWDLGIQRVAFLGARGQNGAGGSCLGLFNQAGIAFNGSLITQSISSMTYTQLATLQQGLIKAYQINNGYTRMPSHFIIPTDDFNGLAAQTSPQFPIKSTLQVLEEGFKIITRKPDFKILPNAYASVSNAGGAVLSGVSGQVATGLYTLLNYDEQALRMDIPLDYTTTLANSLDNFMFQNAAYGQFTGVLAYKPLEMLYLGY
jgi:hypothetical protein